MFRTRSANGSLVMVFMIGLATNCGGFAYGGPAGDSGNRSLAVASATSPRTDVGEIVLFSPTGTVRDAQYSLNGVPYVMKPGTMQRLKNDRVWNVEVNTETGQITRYTLASGGYKFIATGLRMSMGLFATAERPELATVAAATATVLRGLRAPSTGTAAAIPAPPLPMDESWHAAPRRLVPPATIAALTRPIDQRLQNWLAQQELRKHFGEHSGPTITASQWFNASPAVSGGQFRDKVVLLDFWGSWCGPCVRNLPKIQALYEKYKDRGLIVIGVHSAQGAQSVAGFLAKHSYSFPVAVDSGATAERYRIEAFPTYFLVDKSGQQTWKFAQEPPHDQQIENLLNR